MSNTLLIFKKFLSVTFGTEVTTRPSRAAADLRQKGVVIDDQQHLRRLSPLGWDHINLTGDYVWSESAVYDTDGMRPLNREVEPLAA